ncbi:MAG TPA: ANTAR domain-containing protein [Actinophytocola sp.]|uniref:ANTAR domain-containing protein n=1 Tax=Actinophytocola sp. TaxID=1872138 RepID=UPI002F95D4D1
MTGTLDLTAEPVGSALVLSLSGVLDHATAAASRADFRDEALAMPAPGLLVFDLRDLDLATAAGARALDDLASLLRSRGIACRSVVEPDSPPAKTLRSVGLDAYLPMFDTVEDALAAAAPGTGQALPSLRPSTRPSTRPPTRPPLRPPSQAERIASRLAEMTREVLDERTVAAAMGHVVDAALAVVPHAKAVSVTLQRPDGTFYTPATTAEIAVELDKAQYGSGHGPCVDAADPRGPAYTVSVDLTRDERWPRFTSRALAYGLGAVLSTALLPHGAAGVAAGALNIYTERNLLTEADRVRALLLATHASLALAHIAQLEARESERTQFRQALESRDVIGQAKGILMHRQGYTAEHAFEVLRKASQDLNIKVVDLARTLTTRHHEIDREIDG